jgi:mono/diheme cytochrome c family protein
MKPLTTSRAVALIGFSLALGARIVVSDPASSSDTAWSTLPDNEQSRLSDPLERRGQAVFRERCGACHGPVPDEIFGPAFLPPMPGTQALQARYRGALPAVLEERTDLTAQFVASVVRSGLPAMPFFRPTEVSDDDLEAVAAYLTRSR